MTLVVAVRLAVRGVLEVVLGARLRRHRWLMIALGVVNLLLAAYLLWTLPWSALALSGLIFGASLLFGGVAAILSGLSHKQGAPAFAAPA